jgi:hypothetical protein
MFFRYFGGVAALCAVVAGVPDRAFAAGAAYQVDTAEISEPGSCKVESWASFANNRDFIASVAPACVVQLYRAVEVSAQFSRTRSDEEWGTSATPKLKTQLRRGSIGSWAVAVTAVSSYDLLTGENTGFAFAVPATLRLNNNQRINVNLGYLRDRVDSRDYLTYGFGIDSRTSDNVWTVTAEVFGITGVADNRSAVQPRWQVGLRYRPIDEFNVDLIYGRNLTGENANWITLATIVRFKLPESGASRP